MRLFNCCMLAMISSAIVPTVSAQDIDEESLALLYGDKSTVSIATGSRQELRRAPAVATVITAEDIAAMGATTIDEVLEAVPGMHVMHAPSMNATSYIMRGGTISPLSAQVSVLQNGIPTLRYPHIFIQLGRRPEPVDE